MTAVILAVIACHQRMTTKTMTVILLEVKNLYHLWRKNKRFRHLVCHPWEMMMTDDRCGKKMLLRSVAKWQSHLPSRFLKKKGDDDCHRKRRWQSFFRWRLATSGLWFRFRFRLQKIFKPVSVSKPKPETVRHCYLEKKYEIVWQNGCVITFKK